MSATVIVLGVDSPIGVAVLRDLAAHGFTTIGIGNDSNSIGFASRYCNVPIVREIEESKLVTQLTDLAANYKNVALLAVSEADLLFVNRHRDRLGSKLNVATPSQSRLDLVLNKRRTLSLAQTVGISTHLTYHPKSLGDIQNCAEKFCYPVVLKWPDPNQVGRQLSEAGLELKKCEYAFSADDLLLKLKPYQKVNIFPLIQEYCEGVGLGQMFLIRDGEVVLEFQHERINEWPPEGGVSTYCKSVPLDMHKECREKSISLLKSLSWEGVAMVEYRFDQSSKEYFFMEINGRFWGSLPLAVSAGVSFPAESVKCLLPDYEIKEQQKYKLIKSRYMVPEVRRLMRLLFQPSKIADPYFRYSAVNELIGFLLTFFKPNTRYYLLRLKDPGPFFRDILNMIAKLCKR